MRKSDPFRLVLILAIFSPIALALAVRNHPGHTAAPTPADPIHRSIADYITDLQADDARAQVDAAQQLGISVLDDGSRTAVLKALESHLASDDRTLRLASVNAYAHWATEQETPQLLNVIASRSSKEAQDGSSITCAAAVVGLIRVNPEVADQAVRERMDDFFFRDHTTQTLLTFSEMEPAYSATAISLLKLIDLDDKNIRLSPAGAVVLLASDSATSRTDAANALKIAPITTSDRPAVLRALSTHLQGSDGRTRLPFVRAFAHWADQNSIADLQKIVAFPDPSGRTTGHEDCWSAAIAGLVRLNAAQPAIDAYNSRVEDRQLNFSLQRAIEPLARDTGPAQPLASDFLQQLKEPHATRLRPLAPASPANSTANRL